MARLILPAESQLARILRGWPDVPNRKPVNEFRLKLTAPNRSWLWDMRADCKETVSGNAREDALTRAGATLSPRGNIVLSGLDKAIYKYHDLSNDNKPYTFVIRFRVNDSGFGDDGSSIFGCTGFTGNAESARTANQGLQVGLLYTGSILRFRHVEPGDVENKIDLTKSMPVDSWWTVAITWDNSSVIDMVVSDGTSGTVSGVSDLHTFGTPYFMVGAKTSNSLTTHSANIECEFFTYMPKHSTTEELRRIVRDPYNELFVPINDAPLFIGSAAAGTPTLSAPTYSSVTANTATVGYTVTF